MADDDDAPVDRRGRLAGRPFTCQLTRDKILISWRGRIIKTLAGDEAKRFRAELAATDEDGAQLLLAKVTGNFKRGTEPRR